MTAAKFKRCITKECILYNRAVHVLHISTDFRESTPIAPPLRLEILTTNQLTTVTGQLCSTTYVKIKIFRAV